MLADLAFGFDWAHPFLTPEQRRRGAAALVKLAEYSRQEFRIYFRVAGAARRRDARRRDVSQSFTFFNNHTLRNHVGVAAAGIATAGDHPAGRMIAESSYCTFTGIILPILDRFVGERGIWNEGTHYNQVALSAMMIWMDAIRTGMGKDFFSASWVRSAAYYWVYLTRSDDTMTILGDWWADQSERTVTNLMARTFWITSRAARASGDPYLQTFANRQLSYAMRQPSDVWALLWYDPDLPVRHLSELRPSRLFHGDPAVGGGSTLAVLRSGWGREARLITLSMGDGLSHHGHYDSTPSPSTIRET